jgi:hypothetical protein
MKPQRPQRNTLRTLKEYPFKEITKKINHSVYSVVIFYTTSNKTRSNHERS